MSQALAPRGVADRLENDEGGRDHPNTSLVAA
jgi:hypothetical protein